MWISGGTRSFGKSKVGCAGVARVNFLGGFFFADFTFVFRSTDSSLCATAFGSASKGSGVGMLTSTLFKRTSGSVRGATSRFHVMKIHTAATHIITGIRTVLQHCESTAAVSMVSLVNLLTIWG